MITAEKFKRCVGVEPESDDLERCNCPKVGEIGHWTCGWDRERDMPNFVPGDRMRGLCAKQPVTCVIVTAKGEHITGGNWCESPQTVCPRKEGEGYEKCKTICKQLGHAEIVAVRLAGEKAKGGRAYMNGHTYACRECQEALFNAGVISLSVGITPLLKTKTK